MIKNELKFQKNSSFESKRKSQKNSDFTMIKQKYIS